MSESGAQGLSFSFSFSFWGVISEARQIIRAHNRHFFALLLLFLFPLYFSSVIYLVLYAALSHLDVFQPPEWLRFFTAQPILLSLLFNLFNLCFTPCALGTITYSTFNAFYGKPLTLASSIKSLLYTFLPLLSTLVVSQTIICFIGIVFGVLVFLGLQSLGVEVNQQPIGFWVFLVLLLVSTILWLQVKWSLAYVIVVEESKWGYEALRRSGQLVKGMRGVALCILLYYGLLGLVMSSPLLFMLRAPAASAHWSWTLVFLALCYSLLGAQIMLHAFAANVVLYIYCKALHGEWEVAQEFGSNYVSLPFQNAKVSEVV